ncbi:MAG: Peptide chain release factor eRF1 [Candidatus Methanohalarchaeum thermophilum]|uniref:Peptide chain release factor subunit 1 n=1 Tax=Methanohalarchaeum thermophilum TaxID=1903181 RepID=A0A1Q6DV80_METT1|nr:MAG: Peptide chain release factor eRF1 [Candidatus Methanohalarchaeum thermophilum]
MDQLRDEYGQASNIKSKRTRKNVQSALDVLMGKVKHFDSPPENGMIAMAGMVSTRGDKSDMKSLIIEPPEKINSYRYHCDSNFLIEPLKDLVEEKKKFGLIVLDRREATVGILKGNNIDPKRHLTSGVPGKTKAGGQSQARFERLRDQAAHEFYKRIAEAANSVFTAEDELVGVLIGGPSPTKEEFLSKDLLHHELEIIDKFDVSYTDEYGLRELVNTASTTLEELRSMEERNTSKEFLNKLVQEEGLVSYGEEQVRKALNIGAVDKLLLSEKLRKLRVSIECKECDYSKEITVEETEFAEVEEEYNQCPKCEGGTEIEAQDLVDDLSEKAEQMGTEVILVGTDFEEGEQIYDAFGGIAAILRFEVGKL